jgi:hypothetical protein
MRGGGSTLFLVRRSWLLVGGYGSVDLGPAAVCFLTSVLCFLVVRCLWSVVRSLWSMVRFWGRSLNEKTVFPQGKADRDLNPLASTKRSAECRVRSEEWGSRRQEAEGRDQKSEGRRERSLFLVLG